MIYHSLLGVVILVLFVLFPSSSDVKSTKLVMMLLIFLVLLFSSLELCCLVSHVLVFVLGIYPCSCCFQAIFLTGMMMALMMRFTLFGLRLLRRFFCFLMLGLLVLVICCRFGILLLSKSIQNRIMQRNPCRNKVTLVYEFSLCLKSISERKSEDCQCICCVSFVFSRLLDQQISVRKLCAKNTKITPKSIKR